MIKKNYVKINQYTRPGRKLHGVKGVVWHYTATPNAPAINIRNYFNGTCINEKRYAGCHIAVDWKEAIQLMPLDEVAFHAHDNNRCYPNELKPNANYNTIAVEMCLDKAGKLTATTFQNAVKVGVELCKKFNLDPMKHFYRHYDITGKNCPAMWVSAPSEFKRFKEEVKKALGGSKSSKSKITGDTYTVKKGDTMYSISKASGVPVDTIKKLNPNVKPEAMKIGQVLKLRPSASSSNRPDYHVVKKGDTFYSMAKKYGMTVAEIQKLNPNVSPNALQIGSKINLKRVATHTIKKGDTFYSLSKKYGVSIAQLQKLNPNVKPTALQIGQKIVVGGK